ncbi:MAG: DoxX family membrane protein [Bacteroidales bacterium]
MEKLTSFESRSYEWMKKHGVVLLRISIGIVFFWFGVQKFFPGVSEAENLATRTIEVMTFGIVKQALGMPLLATWEVIIGLTFLFGRFMRIAIPLLFLQMIGTVTPLFFFPDETFQSVPFIPALEGQYIIKNIVLVTGAMVVGAYHFGFTINKPRQ